jgi:lysyl-tRNA synthetase, class II
VRIRHAIWSPLDITQNSKKNSTSSSLSSFPFKNDSSSADAPTAAQNSSTKKQKQPKKEGGEGGGEGGGSGRNRGRNNNNASTNTSSEAEIRSLRAAKAETLRSSGQDPYAYSFERTHTAAELLRLYEDLPAGETAPGTEEQPVAVAGRVLARRVMGKLAFLKVADDSGEVQLYVDRSALDERREGSFAELKSLVDVGDIVGCVGGVRRTEKGELSVAAHSLSVLTKALRPLPDKWHGLADVEKRYRQRYVDMIATPGVRDALRARALMTSTLRRSLEGRGFLEVETPVLEASAGGADARPFTTYHNALAQPFALRIATELHLKRLVVGGFERVFEIGRIFRNEGVSTRHNPEFTSVELYQAFADYNDMMDLTEELIREAAVAVTGGTKLNYQGAEIDVGSPFARKTMAELVQSAVPSIDASALLERSSEDASSSTSAVDEASRAAAAEALTAAGCSRSAVAAALSPSTSPGNLLNLLFEELVESTLIQPTFVLDHPAVVSPLAKPHRTTRGAAERFELYVAGRELANAYSEMTDPLEQRRRLEAQMASHSTAREEKKKSKTKKAGEAAAAEEEEEDDDDDENDYDVSLDEDFLLALEHGMPPTGGMGMGLDRLAMLLVDAASIRDVIAFPLLKRQAKQQEKGGEEKGAE